MPAIAQALHCTVGVSKDKLGILQCLEDDELMSLLTDDWESSGIHVLPMGSLSHAVCDTFVMFDLVLIVCLCFGF